MSKFSTTYRFATLFTVLLIAVSFALPTVLMGLSICDMETQEVSEDITHENCVPIKNYSSDAIPHLDKGNSADMDCIWTTDCTLTVTESTLPSATFSSNEKVTKPIAVSIHHFIESDKDGQSVFFTDEQLRTDGNPPPIFILNSTFLN